MIPEGVERGEVVGIETCKSCGADIEVKVTKHGGLYGKCFAVINPDAKGHAKYCGQPVQYALWKAREFISDFINEKGAVENVEIHNGQENHGEAKAGDGEGTGDSEETGAREPAGDQPKRGILEQLFGDWDE